MSKLEWYTFTVPGFTGLGGWNARDKHRTYVISHESRSGPGYDGWTGYTASWRPARATSGRNQIGGGPFATLEEAKAAVEAAIPELENARRLAAKSRNHHYH